ncbi:MAG TPA: tyrosine-type recombinase/integrase [Bacillota bacterium]|nr:tyrosine-type recombinase/integrase [Bacillota bacterium]
MVVSLASERRHRRVSAAPPLYPDRFDEFLAVKAAQGRAALTLADYRKHVGAFFHAHPEAVPADELRPAVLAYFQKRSELAPATSNLDLVYLRAFCRWLVAEGHLDADPTRDLHKRRDEGRARALDEDLLTRLLALPDLRTYAGVGDRALLLTLDTGIRPSETLSLRPADVDLAWRTLTVPLAAAKTRRARVLPLSPATVAALRHLSAVRSEGWGADVPLFASETGGRLFGLRERLDRYGRALGVRVRPYDLRHSFALLFVRQGGTPSPCNASLGTPT